MKETNKKTKKAYVLGAIGIVGAAAVAALIVSYINCPVRKAKQFEKEFVAVCQEEFKNEKDICTFINDRLTQKEKESYMALIKHLKETGKKALDKEALQIASADEILDINLKVRASRADLIRQATLNKIQRNTFSGNYECIRSAWTNDLSNEEVLFLQLPQVQKIDSLKELSLKNPNVRQMYINASSKLIVCMDQKTQQRYVEELKLLTPQPAEKKPAPKKKAPKKEEKKEEKKE